LDLTQQFLKGESTQGSTHRLEHGFIELMNFKTCPNCSYRLPVVAAFCSQCGSQLQVPNNDHAKEPAAFWSFAMALIGPIFCLLILALLFWFLMSKEKGHTNSPGILRSFYVRSASVDHSCTTITNYCARVMCVIENKGLMVGEAQVKIVLRTARCATFEHMESRFIPTSMSAVVWSDFSELDLGQSVADYSCHILPY
jgi:hypothetical protein